MTQVSCLYEGMVRHRRFEPLEIGFRYPIELLYLDLGDLDEADDVFGDSRLWSSTKRAPVRFRRVDHLGPADQPLDVSIRQLVETRLGRTPKGPVRLLTSPRYFGLIFNPISLFYCFEADAQTLGALVAEVTNTPRGERHCYVLDLALSDLDGSDGGRAQRRMIPKAFPVSPFMEMEMNYEWRVRTPDRNLTLSIRNELAKRSPSASREFGAPYSQTDLVLNRRELDSTSLRASFWRAPLRPGSVLFGVYRQALRLAWRRVPFIAHPPTRWPRSFDDPELIRGSSIGEARV